MDNPLEHESRKFIDAVVALLWDYYNYSDSTVIDPETKLSVNNQAGGILAVVTDEGYLQDEVLDATSIRAHQLRDYRAVVILLLLRSVGLLLRGDIYDRYDDYSYGAPNPLTLNLAERIE